MVPRRDLPHDAAKVRFETKHLHAREQTKRCSISEAPCGDTSRLTGRNGLGPGVLKDASGPDFSGRKVFFRSAMVMLLAGSTHP